jgi:chromosome segregation ATPase
LQRANDELQEELKAHVLTIEKLQSEYHLAEDRHALEMKEVRTSITKKFLSQLDEMQTMLTQREKELEASAAVCGHQQSTLEELKQQLAFATQSQLEAEDVINSQRTTIQELEKALEDEQMQHMKERAEAEGSLREELERVRNEALEELNSHKEVVSSMQMKQEDLLVLLKVQFSFISLQHTTVSCCS